MRERTYCTVDGCDRGNYGHGLCWMHYKRQRDHGSTDDPRPSVGQRFAALVAKSDGCWLWQGGADLRGYGTFWRDGKNHPAHRVSYELYVGAIPDDMHLDHLCRTPRCVRPDHLEPVTPRENLMRGSTTQAAINAAKTHCIHDHPLAGGNLHIDKDGKRRCNACRRERVRRWRERKRQTV